MSPRSRNVLHTERWGPSDASSPRALLIPGITSSASTMWEVGEGLADAGWSATAVDLPGHGQSPPAESYRFADIADTIVTRLGAGWDLLVGHSLGGAIGTALLAAHPTLAARALLIDPALVISDEVADSLAPQLRADQVEGTEAAVAAENPRWHPRTVAERMHSTRATDVSAVTGFASDNRPWDVRALARAVRVPVHVLVATDGALVSPETMVELSETTQPHWTFETVPDTGHSVHRDEPAFVLDRALRPQHGRVGQIQM
jgi:pimeloyl-ACP methyl ester carboxylesterase